MHPVTLKVRFQKLRNYHLEVCVPFLYKQPAMKKRNPYNQKATVRIADDFF